MNETVSCCECLELVTVNLDAPGPCPKCGYPLLCHNCGTDQPDVRWLQAPGLDIHGMWCSTACVGAAAMSS